MFCTTVEATKGEQLKVIRWQYKPETKLLAATWERVSGYMTTSLAKAPAKLAKETWVQQLQQPSAGLPKPYASTAFGSMPPRQAVQGTQLVQQAVTEPPDAPCVHCGKPRKGNHYQTGACFSGDHSYQLQVRDTEEMLALLAESPEYAALDELLDLTVEVVPYAGVDVSTDGEQVHRDVGEVLNQQGCVVHTEPGRIFSIEEKESK